jgi:hypothetical protein
MSALPNQKHELLARGLADGLTQEKAYIAAGYSPNGARAGASGTLKKYPEILARRDELLKEQEQMYTRLKVAPAVKAARDLGIDKERILAELWDNAMQAKAAVPVKDREGNPTGVYNANWFASNQALQLLGKELGMFSDKKEEAPNPHANKSIEELREIVLEKSRRLGVPLPSLPGVCTTITSKDDK